MTFCKLTSGTPLHPSLSLFFIFIFYGDKVFVGSLKTSGREGVGERHARERERERERKRSRTQERDKYLREKELR